MEYLWDKFNFIILKSTGVSELKDRLKLIFLALVLLIVGPQIELTLFGVLSTIFVIYATYLGFCQGGILASLWSLVVLGFLLKENMININGTILSSFIIMQMFISIGLGKTLRYHLGLIKDLNQTKEALKESNQQLNQKFDKVKRVHKSFFPQKLPQTKNFSFSAFYQPAEIISGDYYNYIELENIIIGYISDVTGHGLDGALLNVFIREKINNFLSHNFRITSQGILKFIVKKFAQENFPPDYSLCITFWVLDKKQGELYYNNAGNHVPLFLIRDNNIQEIIEENPPLSNVFTISDYEFNHNKIELDCRDKVLFSTDGLIEQSNHGNMYGTDRLKRVIEENISSGEDLLHTIYNDFNNFIKADFQQDDITMFYLKRESND